MLRRVEKVKYLSEYKLKLQFDNGKIKFFLVKYQTLP